MMSPSRLGHLPGPIRATGLLALGTFCSWLAVPGPSLEADGGTLRVANVPMGAYRVNVFTDPTPIPPDSIDVSVLVTFERGRGVATGLEIEVVARAAGRQRGRRPTPRHPGTGGRSPVLCREVRPGIRGAWEITVQVGGARRGGRDVAFR